MEVSALKYSGGLGLHGRSPLLRLQSDERLIGFVRKGNQAAFEVLVSRYESRLLSFCRHLLGSREDAEDVLQEVFAAAFNAILADERPINVRPWLYRIARNRSLNHLRRIQAVGIDSMDIHFSDHGASTADKVHEREEFWLLVGDISGLPETQRTALVLREMDALSYEQIAEAMETTVPSVKSLLVRARVSLAEAAEARLLSCDEVRIELGEIAEGLRRRPSPLVRRHLKACTRCDTFRLQLRDTNKALAALLPLGPLALLRMFVLSHLSHSAGSSATAAGSSATAAGSTATAAGSTAAVGSTAAIGSTAAVGTTAGGVISAGIGAIATKAVAGLAVTALVTAGAVEVSHVTSHSSSHVVTPPAVAAVHEPPQPVQFFTTQSSGPVIKHAHKMASTDTTHTPNSNQAVVPTNSKKVQTAVAVAEPAVKPVPRAPVKPASTPTPPRPAPPVRTTLPTVLIAATLPAGSTTATATSTSPPAATPTTAPVVPAPTTVSAADSAGSSNGTITTDTTSTSTNTSTTGTMTTGSGATTTGTGATGTSSHPGSGGTPGTAGDPSNGTPSGPPSGGGSVVPGASPGSGQTP